MTGGAIPPGADAVVKEEDAPCSQTTIQVRKAVPPSQYVLKRGKDLKRKSLVVEQGHLITPPVLGTLASLQLRKVPVFRRPEVSILAVGNELVDIHRKQTNHSIVASNIYMLSAMIKEHGGMVGCAKISGDDKGAFRKDIEAGLKSDMLITTGGSSNADSDLTRGLMEDMGIDLKFAGVSMLPGKGTCFGLDDRRPVFCLPGTPSAVYVAFYTLVLPALLQLMGLTGNGLVPVEAILEQDIEKKPGIEHLVQGLAGAGNDSYRVLPLVGPDVEGFSAMCMANGLIIVDPNKSRLSKGETVSVHPLNPFEASLSGRPLPQEKALKGQKASTAPLVSIVGKSDAGKTTLLEMLVPELKARGYRVGTIKHDVHGFDIDHQGKDSWRHKQAGAHTVVISSPKKVSVIRDIDTEETLDGLASGYFQNVDIILTEGYKREDKPKIEIFRSLVHDKPLCTEDDHLVALVSDIPLDLGVPHFGLNDIEGLADLLVERFLKKS
jgi:molybdopterin-guanine dinucleotide biosynthesis protein B